MTGKIKKQKSKKLSFPRKRESRTLDSRLKIAGMTCVSFLVFWFFGFSVVFAASAPALNAKAGQLYRLGKYDDALKLYNDSLIKQPDSAIINFNIGDCLYQKADYDSAISSFEKALLTPDKALEAKANYNIGNAKYKLGKLKQNSDLGQTVELLRQSLDYYKRAMELEPKDKDAKLNHDFVEKELKELLEKLKKQQEKNKEQQKQQGTEEILRPSGAQDDKSGVSRQSQEIKDDGKGMPEKEAKMILDDYRQDEALAGDIKNERKGNEAIVEKDW